MARHSTIGLLFIFVALIALLFVCLTLIMPMPALAQSILKPGQASSPTERTVFGEPVPLVADGAGCGGSVGLNWQLRNARRVFRSSRSNDMKNRISHIILLASAIVVAAATTGRADARWSRLAPEGAGFSVEVPGEPQPSGEPGQYWYSSGLWFYCIKLLRGRCSDACSGRAAATRRALKNTLGVDERHIAATVNGTIGSSSFAESTAIRRCASRSRPRSSKAPACWC